MITKFGKELRKIRIDNGEILKDMASRLDVSPSFLSAVEVGKKNIPEGWVKKIGQMYKLNNLAVKTLEEAAADSVISVKMELTGLDQPQRQAALVFARDFGNMSDDTAQKIIKLLSKQKQ